MALSLAVVLLLAQPEVHKLGADATQASSSFSKSSLALSYATSASVAEVEKYYAGRLDQSRISYASGADGLGVNIRATDRGLYCVISIRDTDPGSFVKASCEQYERDQPLTVAPQPVGSEHPGSIDVIIRVDGRVLQEASASSQYGIATASGRTE